MNSIMKKQVFISVIFALSAFISLAGERFQIGDLTYEVLSDTEKTVSVVHCNKEVVVIYIPQTISNNDIEYTVTRIGKNSFTACRKLSSVQIPNSITTIDEESFDACVTLTTLTLPNSVKTIGSKAFAYCTALTSLKLSNSITDIGYSAFSECTALTTVNIPSSVTNIGNDAFYRCNALQAINVNSDNQHFKSVDGILFNANLTTLIQYPIGKSQSSYTLPNSTTHIGVNAFSYSQNLISISLHNALLSIGAGAFRYSALKSISIPNSIKSIEARAFLGCSALESINIPNSVISIGASAFSDCSALESINIPNSVTSIGANAFSFSALKSINIPNSIKSIEANTFCYCSALESINIPNSVTSIGDEAFLYCSALKSINIPYSVTNIGSQAFGRCDALQDINVDSNNQYFKSIDGVFFNFDLTTLIQYPIGKLQNSYTLPNSVTTIEENAFAFNCNLSSINLSNSLTSIGDRAFQDCSNLLTINFPNSLTTIGGNILYNCSALTSVTIPSSVIKIENHAFTSCVNLKEVINLADEPQSVNNDIFNLTAISSARLLVKNSSLSAFKNASQWNKFGTIETLQGKDITFYSNNYFNERINVFFPQETETAIPNASILTPYTGFTLEGWTTNYDGSGKFFKAGQMVTSESLKDITTLFAKWVDSSGIDSVNANSITVSNGILRNPEANDIRIIDLSGRIVYYGNDTELTLPSGLYILNTKSGNRKVAF